MAIVVLASKSTLKKEVVQKFFGEHLTVKAEFHFIAAPSNINEQPIGKLFVILCIILCA